MNIHSPDSGWVAFLAGLITSPHCLLMCGPLAYVILTQTEPEWDSESNSNSDSKNSRNSNNSEKSYKHSQLLYNAARIISFTLMGLLAGLIGLSFLKFVNFSVVKYFPWILVIFFIVFGLGLDKLIPKAPFAKRIFARLSEKIAKLPKNLAAILLGFATPFLPCGPLYMILWVALLSGSPTFGAEITFGFALGTIPLMFLAGTQFTKIKKYLNPKTLYSVQRIIALAAAAFLIWRLLMNSSPLTAEFCCPW